MLAQLCLREITVLNVINVSNVITGPLHKAGSSWSVGGPDRIHSLLKTSQHLA